MKVVDTTVAVDFLRGHEAAVQLMTELVSVDIPLVASQVTRFELHAGVRPDELDALETFSSALIWVDVDAAISRLGGELARSHRKAYQGIGVSDYLIAATALVLGADLLTTNVKHFPMIDGIRPPYDSSERVLPQ